MSKTLSVSAIQYGTVIDHIAPGQAWRIIQMLSLLENQQRVTVGLNLFSKSMKWKDLIKIEGRFLSKEEADKITIFAPEATINIIQDFEVKEKITTHFPSSIAHVFSCPNNDCITLAEKTDHLFLIKKEGKQIKLICHYCEKSFDRNQVKTIL